MKADKTSERKNLKWRLVISNFISLSNDDEFLRLVAWGHYEKGKYLQDHWHNLKESHLEHMRIFDLKLVPIETFTGSKGSCLFFLNRLIICFREAGVQSSNKPDDDELADKIKKIRDFGRESGGNDHYLTMGWNLKFSDYQAVIGIEQMKKLPERVARKKEMGLLYERFLWGIKGVETVDIDYDNVPPWFIDILCEDRAELMVFLKKNNIGTRKLVRRDCGCLAE